MSLLFPRLAYSDRRRAVSVDGAQLDYTGLARAAAAHAADLARRGIRPGEVVAVVAHGTLPTVVALVGNVCAGVITVPLNPKLGSREREHILADAKPRVVYEDAASPERFPLEDSMTVGIADGPSDETSTAREVDDAPLFLLYTSGTTGLPKGAVLSGRNVASNIDGLARAWRWSDADTVVHALPLFHVHGLVLGLLGSLRVGGCLYHRSRFDPATLAADLGAHGTMLFAVPTMYHRLVEAAQHDGLVREALAEARLLVSGSAPLTMREHRRIETLTGRGVHERYGLTETLIDCAVPASDPPRPGFVGPPVPGVTVRLVDEERRTIDASDDATIGEVAVRGPNVFLRYLHREDATAAVLDEQGWFYTGDLATRTADGYYRIVGRRATDLIKTGGFKVGAGEIEAFLLEHPAVFECAVVGIADEDLGERICAFVVLRPGAAAPSEAELAQFVADGLSPHKRPRTIRFLDALPRNPMGKVLKTTLRP